MGSQVVCEQPENRTDRAKLAEFSEESANTAAQAALSSSGECSIWRKDWLPIGH